MSLVRCEIEPDAVFEHERDPDQPVEREEGRLGPGGQVDEERHH